MKRVLVTGTTGFIGSHCVPLLLEAGYEVHGVVPAGVEPNAEGVVWHMADLLEADQMNQLLHEVRPTHLLHLAWFVAPGEFWRSTENLRWLAASLDLMREFADVGGLRSVMAGTCAEYAESMEPLVEGVTPLRPTTLYGACKTALHVASVAYFKERDVSNAWGHIFYLFGPGEHPSRLVPSVIGALSRGGTFACQRPDDIRDFLDVRDVAGAFVALLESAVEGDVNIASGDATKVGALVNLVGRELGLDEIVACRPGEKAESSVVGSTDRLRGEVGWSPRETLESGILSTIAWWKGGRL